MGNQAEIIYLGLWRWPSKTELRFGYQSPRFGHQIWDCDAWLLGDTPMTERAFLQELYAGVLHLQERRA